MKLGYLLGLSAPLWKHTRAHRQSHLCFYTNTDFIDILEATSGVYASERILTISTLKSVSKSLLENHQLLYKSVVFSREVFGT